MLSFLKISNLAIVEELCLEPGPGLNVLTGETGAGKSILVDALALVLGERGSADLIRSGSEGLLVEAQFDLSSVDGDLPVAESVGLRAAERELIVRRELSRPERESGSLRSRGFLNGRMASLGEIRTVGEHLADLHGQHQHQSLLRPEGQREALDRFAGAADAAREVTSRHAACRSLARQVDELLEQQEQRSRLEEALRSEIAQIESARLEAGEEERLRREEGLLRHAEEISRLAARAFARLSEDDESALARLGEAEECASKLAGFDPQAREVAEALREARLAAAEAARGLSGYLDRDEAEIGRLEQVAGRLARIEQIKRRFGPTLAEVLERAARARARLEDLAAAGGKLAELQPELAAARAELLESARALSQRRRRAAARLERAVMKELAEMAMAGTRLRIAVTDAGSEPGPHGLDDVEFRLAANEGEEPGPLSRAASGGELSRLMLALRTAAQTGESGRTLVFDEVDAGIGGRAAEAVGRRLAALARSHQILCVTHLPQIASLADVHFQVEKVASGGRTRAAVRRAGRRPQPGLVGGLGGAHAGGRPPAG